MESKINIQSYSNFLTQEEHNYVASKTLRSDSWSYSAISNESDSWRFWHMELVKDIFFTDHMFNKIKTITKKNFVIQKVYANGQTYGLSGSYHQDVEWPNPTNDSIFKTFLYYVNPIWKSEWGGSTLFKQDEEVYTQPFIPNNAILFDSTAYHVGLEPTRLCPDLRVTVAFKLQEQI